MTTENGELSVFVSSSKEESSSGVKSNAAKSSEEKGYDFSSFNEFFRVCAPPEYVIQELEELLTYYLQLSLIATGETAIKHMSPHENAISHSELICDLIKLIKTVDK